MNGYDVVKIAFTGDGTFSADRMVPGEIVAVAFDISGGAGVIDLTVQTRASDGFGPSQQIMAVVNLAADTWYYPTAKAVDEAGTDRLFAATFPVPVRKVVHARLDVVVTGSGANPGTVYVIIKKD